MSASSNSLSSTEQDIPARKTTPTPVLSKGCVETNFRISRKPIYWLCYLKFWSRIPKYLKDYPVI